MARSSPAARRKERGDAKVSKVMHEYAEGALHSGSSSGPIVHDRKQAIAIALSEKRRAGRRKRGH